MKFLKKINPSSVFVLRVLMLSSLPLTTLLGANVASAQVPGAPSIDSVVAGDSQAFVLFTAPVSGGGSGITAHTAACSAGASTLTGTSATSPIVVAGLVNGTAYACTVTAANVSGSSSASSASGVTPSASAPLTLLGIKSRKIHAAAGPFDVAVDSAPAIGGAVSTESRKMGTGHSIIFQYNATVSAIGTVTAVDSDSAAVATTPGFSGNEVVVPVTGVADTKRVTVSLSSVNGTPVTASASVGFLLGDVDNSRVVDYAGDVALARANAGQKTTASNYRFDVNTSGAITAADIAAIKSRASGAPVIPVPEAGTIMFVTQVPIRGFLSRGSTFGNHLASMEAVPRGGDLMLRYADGVLRNLTKEAGFGNNPVVSGVEQQRANAIAVREPSVHWSGNKALFSMIVGAPTAQFQVKQFQWQIYEVTGLLRGQTAVITKIANQPLGYNNVSPFYGTDERVLFTSDRPRDGQSHLYPQLDEYESARSVTGIWSLNPGAGDLRLLNHTPSGAFSPSIDSFGRVVFIRWDHLQQDQQADVDRANPGAPTYNSANYTSEAANATRLNGVRTEVYPESRLDTVSPVFGPVDGHTFNYFTPWQINEDGTDEETLNHIGRHEFGVNEYLPRSFRGDNAMTDASNGSLNIANHKSIRGDGGMFHLREDPLNPGTFYATSAREFGTNTSDQIIKVTASPNLSAESMVITNITKPDGAPVPPSQLSSSPGGRYRNPLPLKSGSLVASHTTAMEANDVLVTDFRLKTLNFNNATNFFEAGAPLTTGISKSISWFSPDAPLTFNGVLWELEAVEVTPRARPAKPVQPLEAPEASVFTEEAVNETAFRTWLKNNDLALIVTRNQTTRDRGDLQQPFNLQVPGGVKTVATGTRGTGRLYDISHFQIFQADLIRTYVAGSGETGRRVIAQPLHDGADKNPANPGGPAGSVKIAADGSTAAFVPARRALAWQSTDNAGNPVVRERVWVTMQPGEVRVCASCHGANVKDQAGQLAPTNKPEALRTLLQAWKLLPP
ncbi:MAG: hypothetical protein ABI905_13495 [Betaproteobacteria bacterium]